MSETFYNLTIARNIQLSRNEKEKSPQNPSKSPFNNKPWMKYNYRREKVKMIGRLPSAWIGEEEISEISIPMYVFASAVDEGRRVGWFSVGRGVVPCQPQRPLTMTSRNAKGDETVARRSTRA